MSVGSRIRELRESKDISRSELAEAIGVTVGAVSNYENEVSSPLSTAFGVNRKPTWDDLQTFLKDRCVPQERDGLKYYLSDLGLDCYDPLAIIRKTEGRMAEDSCWIKIVEG